jgi:hypothetical protein
MNERIKQIRLALLSNDLNNTVKLLLGFKQSEQLFNLNYYRAIFAIKVGDFDMANSALDLELKFYPENKKAMILKQLISKPETV